MKHGEALSAVQYRLTQFGPVQHQTKATSTYCGIDGFCLSSTRPSWNDRSTGISIRLVTNIELPVQYVSGS